MPFTAWIFESTVVLLQCLLRWLEGIYLWKCKICLHGRAFSIVRDRNDRIQRMRGWNRNLSTLKFYCSVEILFQLEPRLVEGGASVILNYGRDKNLGNCIFRRRSSKCLDKIPVFCFLQANPPWIILLYNYSVFTLSLLFSSYLTVMVTH